MSAGERHGNQAHDPHSTVCRAHTEPVGIPCAPTVSEATQFVNQCTDSCQWLRKPLVAPVSTSTHDGECAMRGFGGERIGSGASVQRNSHPRRRSAAASRTTISDLMKQCSRHDRAGTTSHQRSTLPTNRQGHDLPSGLNVQDMRVLTRRRLPTTRSLPDRRLPELIRTARSADTSAPRL